MFILFFICFFKQKTAYEMRISDWSSDVCSSDLVRAMIFFLTKSGFTGSFDPVRVRLGRSCSDWQRKTRLGECRAGLEARSVDRLRFERRLGAVRLDRKSTRLNSSH